jgi:kynureninase
MPTSDALYQTLLATVGSDDITSSAFACALDAQDELAEYRKEFYFPGKHHTTSLGGTHPDAFRYFCGNSLGLQHRDVGDAVQQEVVKWRTQGVEGHFLQPNPWFEIDDVLRDDMAQLVGALPSEVVIMNSLTANLHLLLTAFYRPEGKRRKLMSEIFPFPSDTHAFVSQVQNHGLVAEECYVTVPASTPSGGPEIITTEAFLDAIETHGDEVAVIVLGAVHFLTGQYMDIGRITEAAHAKGILVGVDAAHAAGNVPLQLHDWNVDFACWCTYKYLNAGPGNIAGLFVHDRHTSEAARDALPASVLPVAPLRGWWGHQRTNRFSLHRNFDASIGAAAFQLSNPCVLSIMSLAPSLRLAARVGMPALRSKSLLLTRYMEALIEARLTDRVVSIVTPKDPAFRGCQLSIRIKPGTLKARDASSEAYACGNDLKNDADLAQRVLLDRGIVVDNRPPDILRLAPVPMYNSFEDVWTLVDVLASMF